jgi:hypothetical protein
MFRVSTDTQDLTRYVIQDKKTGRYLAMPGCSSSFTSRIQDARILIGRETARAEMCEDSERLVKWADAVA